MGNLLGSGHESDELEAPHEVAMCILQHCGWRARGRLLQVRDGAASLAHADSADHGRAVAQLTRGWGLDIARDPATWHFLCERLEVEEQLYCRAFLPSSRRAARGL